MSLCTAIKIDEPNFCVEFNQDKIWVTQWKWPDGQTLENLGKRMSKYPILKDVKEEYEHKLQTCLDNS